MNWDDLRYLLAVAIEGSLSKAATALNVNPTTVTRRLQALEEEAGVQLFERMRRGIELTSAGKDFLEAALAIEKQMMRLDAKMKGKEEQIQGELHVTMLDFLGILWAKELQEFAEMYPELCLEVTTGTYTRDLFQREADVSIRLATAPDERLVGRKIARVAHAAYAHEALFEDRNQSYKLSDYPWMSWITGKNNSPESWLNQNALGVRVVARIDAMPIMLEYLKAGMGAATLPCMIGDGIPQLKRIVEVDFGLDLWLLTHPELHRSPKVRAFFDHMQQVFSDWKRRIEGHV